MDLDLIQTHLDNFVTTWTNWGAIFDNVEAFWTNLTSVTEFLSSEKADAEGVSTALFPKTSADS